jgi:hypothetical protein
VRKAVSDSTKFEMFAVTNIDWPALTEADRKSIGETFISTGNIDRWWTDGPDPDLRYSVVHCGWIGDYLFGLITQQHRLLRHLYSDKKQESREEVTSYDDRLFLLDPMKGYVVLEWRRFYNKPDLSPKQTTARLARIFTSIANEIGLTPQEVTFEPIHTETSKAEFLSLFYDHRTIEVEISQVGSEAVPDDIVLVNPTPGLEGSLREILHHDADLIHDLHAESNLDSQADLRKSAIIRGAMHSGDPHSLRYQAVSGDVKVRHKTENGSVSVSIGVLSTDSVEDRIEMAARVLREVNGIDLLPVRQLKAPAEEQKQLPSPYLDLFDE